MKQQAASNQIPHLEISICCFLKQEVDEANCEFSQEAFIWFLQNVVLIIEPKQFI